MIQVDKDPEIADSIEFILSEWGEPTQYIEADEESLSLMGGYVPERIIRYWKVLGFSIFKNGLLCIINPLEWQHTVDEWIDETELESLDKFIPLFKGAYGDIRLFGVEHGCTALLCPVTAMYVGSRQKDISSIDVSAGVMFGDDLDQYDFYEASCNYEKHLINSVHSPQTRSMVLSLFYPWVAQ